MGPRSHVVGFKSKPFISRRSYANKKGLGKAKRHHCSLSQERILREEEHEKKQGFGGRFYS